MQTTMLARDRPVVAWFFVGVTYKADENIIIGNICLYSATSGEAFIHGITYVHVTQTLNLFHMAPGWRHGSLMQALQADSLPIASRGVSKACWPT